MLHGNIYIGNFDSKKSRPKEKRYLKVLITTSESKEFIALTNSIDKPIYALELGKNQPKISSELIQVFKKLTDNANQAQKLVIIPLETKIGKPISKKIQNTSNHLWLSSLNIVSAVLYKDSKRAVLQDEYIENSLDYLDKKVVYGNDIAIASKIDIAKGIWKVKNDIKIISIRMFLENNVKIDLLTGKLNLVGESNDVSKN